MCFRNYRLKSAFTLIELLVCIAIIGILAGLVIAVVGTSRQKANNVRCISNLRQVYVGVTLYVNDEKGYLPPSYEPSAGNWPAYTWMYKLAPYINPGRIVGSSDANRDICFNGVLRCPSKKDWKIVGTDQERISYTMNTFNDASEIAKRTQLSSIPEPRNTLLVVETKSGNISVVNNVWLYRSAYGPALRHADKDNVLFCDGRIQAFPVNSFNYDLTLKK